MVERQRSSPNLQTNGPTLWLDLGPNWLGVGFWIPNCGITDHVLLLVRRFFSGGNGHGSKLLWTRRLSTVGVGQARSWHNVVVFKFLLKNKSREPQSNQPIQILVADDADIQFEFILSPMNKAELAHMLSERCKALDHGAYTTRMWRYHIREEELRVEMEKQGGSIFGF